MKLEGQLEIGEVLSDGVIREEGVGGEVDKGDRVINEGNQTSYTHVNSTALTDSGVACEGVGW